MSGTGFEDLDCMHASAELPSPPLGIPAPPMPGTSRRRQNELPSLPPPPPAYTEPAAPPPVPPVADGLSVFGPPPEQPAAFASPWFIVAWLVSDAKHRLATLWTRRHELRAAVARRLRRGPGV